MAEPTVNAASRATDEEQSPPAGLCGECRWSRSVVNRRGSDFLLCERGRHDPAFPKYPRLPVLTCRGFARNDTEG